MGNGVLEPRSGISNVPGTVTLADQALSPAQDAGNLQHTRGKNKEIILSPQPSNDPNDPLNWSYWRRIAIVCITVYAGSLCAACTGPLLNSGLVVIALSFHKSIQETSRYLSGYQLLVAGATGPLLSALAKKYGKRPAFVFSTIACLIGTIIGSCSTTWNTLMAGRVIQGLGIAAYESLIFPLVSDLFFVHERGLYPAVMAFLLLAIGNICSVVTGRIVLSLGWPYLFHIMTACVGLAVILVFLFVPETTYRRHLVARDPGVEPDEKSDTKPDPQITQIERLDTPSTVPPRQTFVQSLALYTGTYTDDNLVRLFFAPFAACTNVIALWTIVITGSATSFYVAVSIIIAQVFSPPPYLLDTAAIGNISLGPFIGGALGCVFSAMLLDPITIWLTKRNGGIFEPEFRLPLSIVGLLCPAGLFAFGYMCQTLQSPALASFAWGLSLFGIYFTVTPVSAYVLDAFPKIVDEIFIFNIMFKNFLFFGYTTFVSDWVIRSGVEASFYTFGGVGIGLVMLTVPVYVFGKQYRAFCSRHDLMKAMGFKVDSN
ncbi:serine/threonine kinase 16, partial [Aureobasidium melanogenum]